MKHVIIGTAGHVDHGKSSLIRALTGTDPDRLKEEQERGMTIDLGFASLTLTDGTVAGIVDVPGHERFLKNMLAGAGGIDVALLVVAADEGIMPQTIEHLEILDLLQVRAGVAALTKADLVDAEWLHLVEEEVRGLLKGTSLAEAPVLCVDALSGRGLDNLVEALSQAAQRVEPKDTAAPFRLPVDRAFTMPGFGPVVTGTLSAGIVKVGDAAEIMPKQIPVRVRGLQSHGKRMDQLEAGMRSAVNLAGVEAKDLGRGDVLAAPGLLKPVRIFDAALRVLGPVSVLRTGRRAYRALETGMRVRLYLGTAEVLARVEVLGARRIEPGTSGYVRLRCERDTAVLRGDRFVVRTYSPMEVVGGGLVLDADPARGRRSPAATLASLRLREAGSLVEIVADWLGRQSAGTSVSEVARGVAAPEEAVRNALDHLAASGEAVFLSPDFVVHSQVLADLGRRVHGILAAYHEAHPLRSGMSRQELRVSLARTMDARCYAALLQYWHDAGTLRVTASAVRLPDFAIRLTSEQAALAEKVEDVLKKAQLGMATLDEMRKATGAASEAILPVLGALVEQGIVVRLGEGLYAHREGLDHARLLVEELIRKHGSITVAQLRDASATSRRYALAVLEYLDRSGITVRRGDERVLAEV
ncbi:MAG: selenocysteine-specific translation elongation factor [Chthonomonadales bacterium]